MSGSLWDCCTGRTGPGWRWRGPYAVPESSRTPPSLTHRGRGAPLRDPSPSRCRTRRRPGWLRRTMGNGAIAHPRAGPTVPGDELGLLARGRLRWRAGLAVVRGPAAGHRGRVRPPAGAAGPRVARSGLAAPRLPADGRRRDDGGRAAGDRGHGGGAVQSVARSGRGDVAAMGTGPASRSGHRGHRRGARDRAPARAVVGGRGWRRGRGGGWNRVPVA